MEACSTDSTNRIRQLAPLVKKRRYRQVACAPAWCHGSSSPQFAKLSGPMLLLRHALLSGQMDRIGPILTGLW